MSLSLSPELEHRLSLSGFHFIKTKKKDKKNKQTGVISTPPFSFGKNQSFSLFSVCSSRLRASAFASERVSMCRIYKVGWGCGDGKRERERESCFFLLLFCLAKKNEGNFFSPFVNNGQKTASLLISISLFTSGWVLILCSLLARKGRGREKKRRGFLPLGAAFEKKLRALSSSQQPLSLSPPLFLQSLSLSLVLSLCSHFTVSLSLSSPLILMNWFFSLCWLVVLI